MRKSDAFDKAMESLLADQPEDPAGALAELAREDSAACREMGWALCALGGDVEKQLGEGLWKEPPGLLLASMLWAAASREESERAAERWAPGLALVIKKREMGGSMRSGSIRVRRGSTPGRRQEARVVERLFLVVVDHLVAGGSAARERRMPASEIFDVGFGAWARDAAATGWIGPTWRGAEALGLLRALRDLRVLSSAAGGGSREGPGRGRL